MHQLQVSLLIFSGTFGDTFGHTLGDTLGDAFGDTFGTLLGHFWGHFLGQFTHEHYNLNGSNFQLKCEDSECTNFRLGFSELKL